DGGARARVIAGDAAGGRLAGPGGGLAGGPKFLDVTLPEDATFREAVPRGHTAFAYVDQGEVRFGPERKVARAPSLVVFGDGDLVEAAGAPGGGRFLLAAARARRARARRGALPPRGGGAAGGADRPPRPVRDEHAGGDRGGPARPAQRALHPRRPARCVAT